MATQRPLVLISGNYSELPAGDTPLDVTIGTYVVGSGLTGGDNFSQASSLAVSLAPTASGLILVGAGSNARLADDGSAQRLANQALASGNFALSTSAAATASGNASLTISAQAIASGTAVQQAVDNLPRGSFRLYTAAASIPSGSFVGINPANLVEPIRTTQSPIYPSGFYWRTVSSGTSTYERSVVYAPNIDRFVVYQYETGVSAYSTVRVLQSNGSSITVGTPYVVSNYGSSYGCLSYNTVDDNFVIAYYDNSGYLSARPFTVNATNNAVTWGTNRVVKSATSYYIRSTFNPDQNVHQLFYQRTGGVFAYNAVVSGSTLYPGPEALVDTAGYGYCDVAYSTGDKRTLFLYTKDSSDPYYGVVARLAVSSGVNLYPIGGRKLISTNTPVYPNYYYGYYCRVAYNSRQNLFASAYTDVYDGYSLHINALRASGESIEVGNTVTYRAYGSYNAIAACSGTNSFLVTSLIPYPSGAAVALQVDQSLNITGGPQDPFSAYIFPSGTTVLPGNLTYYNELAADTSRNQFLNTCIMNYNPYITTSGLAILFKLENYTLPYASGNINSVVGVAQDSAVSGQAVNVRLPGSIQTGFTGLTPGLSYYVNPVTSGLTTSSTRPAFWSGVWKPAGTALSSTSLLLESDL